MWRSGSMRNSPRSSTLASASLGLVGSFAVERRSTALTRSTSSRCENGLRMKSSAPILSPNSSSISSSLEVRKITGISDFCRSRRSISMPSMRGILMSRTATSGGLVLKPSSRTITETQLDADEFGANNLNSLIERVSGNSVMEIDKLIAELQTLRDYLQNEGQRVQREVAEYAHMSQAATKSTKIIAESLAQWKQLPESNRGARG